MSSFKNAQKSNQKRHRERPQLESRKHLGLLEKKKDYKERADEHQRKQKTLKALKRKALDKNPDEFYFGMVNSRLEDGVHQCKDETPVYTEAQLKLISSQDIKYVNYKHSMELKKIERLKASLHSLNEAEKTPNKHIVFVDSKKEARQFDAAKHFDTLPEFVDRKYNRPRAATVLDDNAMPQLDPEAASEAHAQRKKGYAELRRREERVKQLKIIAEKLQMKRHLSASKEAKRLKVKDETRSSAAVYKWAPQRKR